MKTKIPELSEIILQKLLEYKEKYLDFTFSLRERDSGLSKEKRLENGFWFQGSDYIYVPLFSKGDNDRKIKSIGFVITFTENNAINNNYIEISFKGKNFDNKEVDFHKEVADTFGIELNQDNFGYYIFESKEDYLKNLEFYIGDFRNQVMKLLEKYNLREKYIVPEKKLQKRLEKIAEIKRIGFFSNEKDNAEINQKPMKHPLNQILFGAPGTGKTYNTKRIAVEIINGKKERTREEINTEYEDLVNTKQIFFTTFHQSLSYEDFIEGIKPETTDGNVTYEVKDGIFKQMCKVSKGKTSVNFDDLYNVFIKDIESKQDFVFQTPVHKKEFDFSVNTDQTFAVIAKTEKATKALITKDMIKNYVVNGIIGSSWKSYTLGIGDYFKENYDVVIEDKENSDKNYVFIIDEINRGNVSAIFGELITLLEEDKRKGNKEQTEVILPYSKEKFSVPNNVYIIGTMNTADRSVEALDTALRRRFSFVEMQPNPEVLSNSEYQDIDLKQLLETINQRIEVLVDKDHQIGHSYFIGIQNLEDLKQTFKDKIIPLLEEYFYGDFGKIGLVLGGSFIYQEENKAKFPKNFSYENDFLEDKKVYRFTPFKNWNEQTFISVYED